MIKYRGVSKQSGGFVYGYYAKINHTPYIVTYDSRLVEIIPDSLTYFVGYDKNHEEIYHLDIVELNDEEVQIEAFIKTLYSLSECTIKLKYKGDVR